jgi:hypothetical protein
LWIFGCDCFPLLKPYNTNKLQPKTSTCIFLGYAGQYKGYFCFFIQTNRFFVTRFDPDFQPENLCVVLPLSPMNLHPMTTRSKNGISKRKFYSADVQSVDLSQVEPNSFKVAFTIIEWQSAMREEIDALHA